MIRDTYSPGPANVATVDKQGDNWTLVLVKQFRHSPDKVWDAITDPAQLREWAPFDANNNMGTEGAQVTLTTIGAPAEYAAETTVDQAEPPKLLAYKWGENAIRWELEPVGDGTRLTLWAKIPRPYIAMGAAGWHIAFDVLEKLLEGNPIGRITGPDAMKFEGWQRLNKEYSEQFGVKAPSW
ncbi:MAG TPA: SRPBCC family protein [Fimbriimonas sp.]|nr:SRPBCC family protein [Fimbriimonas sp.]